MIPEHAVEASESSRLDLRAQPGGRLWEASGKLVKPPVHAAGYSMRFSGSIRHGNCATGRASPSPVFARAKAADGFVTGNSPCPHCSRNRPTHNDTLT